MLSYDDLTPHMNHIVTNSHIEVVEGIKFVIMDNLEVNVVLYLRTAMFKLVKHNLDSVGLTVSDESIKDVIIKANFIHRSQHLGLNTGILAFPLVEEITTDVLCSFAKSTPEQRGTAGLKGTSTSNILHAITLVQDIPIFIEAPSIVLAARAIPITFANKIYQDLKKKFIGHRKIPLLMVITNHMNLYDRRGPSISKEPTVILFAFKSIGQSSLDSYNEYLTSSGLNFKHLTSNTSVMTGLTILPLEVTKSINTFIGRSFRPLGHFNICELRGLGLSTTIEEILNNVKPQLQFITSVVRSNSINTESATYYINITNQAVLIDVQSLQQYAANDTRVTSRNRPYVPKGSSRPYSSPSVTRQ